MGAPRAVVEARNALLTKPTLRAPKLVRARCPHPARPWRNQTGFFSSLLAKRDITLSATHHPT
jgi:hypothetical protein